MVREGFPEEVPQEKSSKHRGVKAPGVLIKPVSQGHHGKTNA